MGALPESAASSHSSARNRGVPVNRARIAALAVVPLVSSTMLLGGSVSTALAAEPAEQIVNGTFDAGTAPWWWTGNSPASVVNGQLCAAIPGGTVNPWDAIVGQNDLHL